MYFIIAIILRRVMHTHHNDRHNFILVLNMSSYRSKRLNKQNKNISVGTVIGYRGECDGFVYDYFMY